MALAYLTTVFVPLLPLLLLAVAVLASDEEVAKHCRFSLEGQDFDLCPIMKAGKDSNGWTVEWENQTPPTITKTQYRISFTGPLPRDESKPEHVQCPEGTWICLSVFNRRPNHDDEPVRLLQKVPVAGRLTVPQDGLSSAAADEEKTALNVTVQLSPWQKDDRRHKTLHVRYHGGRYVNQAQYANIQFLCDHEAEEPSSPTFLYNFRGQHSFQWRTKHACGQMAANQPADDPPPSDPEVNEPPVDNGDSTETELIDLPTYDERSSRARWTMILSSTAVVAFIIYLSYSPPPFVKRRILSFMRSRPSFTRFRVGENVLLRWAQEDMGYENGEEDHMVNGEQDPDFYADEEQIPLKPSPRKGHVSSYGSAP